MTEQETPAERMRRLLDKTRGMKPKKRLKRLNEELHAAVAEHQLTLLESYSLLYGNGTTDLMSEDPVADDGERWDEVGLRGAANVFDGPPARSEEQLRRARAVGRALANENEFAMGAHANRVSYTVGKGLMWRVKPKSRDRENADLTAAANASIAAFVKANDFGEVTQEFVHRSDRDGDGILRLFPRADEPLAVRFGEPEDLRSPTVIPDGARIVLGVEFDPADSRRVIAYWFLPPGGTEPVRELARDPYLDIPLVVHQKMNVDMNAARGWPTMWPIRRNLARAEKLLRNMSYVAALQAAIALIRKHDNMTGADVDSFLDRERDLLVTNTQSGKKTRYRGVQAGTVIDAPRGTSYEAPVSSVNAGNNVSVLQADLRAAGARLNMPEYMFSGDSSNAAYASSLVAESPAVKNFECLQLRFSRPLGEVVWAHLQCEVFWRRLPPQVLTDYELQVDLPGLVVRDQLQEAQRKQILRGEGVISRITWRAQDGLDDANEERNLDMEVARGYPDPRAGGAEAGAGAKPPPGSTPGGPGGSDMRGNPAQPGTAPAGDKF